MSLRIQVRPDNSVAVDEIGGASTQYYDSTVFSLVLGEDAGEFRSFVESNLTKGNTLYSISVSTGDISESLPYYLIRSSGSSNNWYCYLTRPNAAPSTFINLSAATNIVQSISSTYFPFDEPFFIRVYKNF